MQTKIPESIQNKARDTVAKAIVGGDEDLIRKAMGYMKGQGGRSDAFRMEMDTSLPENQKGDDEAEAAFQAGNERAHERRMRREEKAREKKKPTISRRSPTKRSMS